MNPIPQCNLDHVRRIAHYCAAIAFHGGLVAKEEAQAMAEAVAEIEARRGAMGVIVPAKPRRGRFKASEPEEG